LSRSQAYVLAAIVALGILAAGSGYALVRPVTYESSAVVALAPRAEIPADDIPTLTGGFTNSAILGTYVELIASADTLREAGSPPVTVQARAVPASRVINVTAKGSYEATRPGLVSVLQAAILSAQRLHDAWELRILQTAQAPVAAGPSSGLIVAASVVLALFGVVLLFVVLRHLNLFVEPLLGPLRERTPPPQPDEALLSGVSPRRRPRRRVT
jgi:uncharacterized protein involved in exopolysaccharide biosynthesis